jgi:hypothetical protein
VVSVLAATALALRLLPLATRLGVRLAGWRNSFPGLLGMWQADRRPHAGPVLLLVLSLATAVLAPTVAATWQQSQRDQAGHAVGADLRLISSDPRIEPEVLLLADHPGVSGMMAAHRSLSRLPDVGRVPVLALESTVAAGTVRLRGDLSAVGSAELFDVLRDGRPEPEAIPLPEGARRLTGTVRFDAPREVTVAGVFHFLGGSEEVDFVLPGPTSHRPAVHLADDRGIVTSHELSSLAAGEPQPVDLPLPAGARSVVGFGAGLIVPQSFFSFSIEDADPVEVSWHWDLAAVDAAGRTHPLTPPASWGLVHHPDQRTGVMVPDLEVSGGVVSTLLDLSRHPQQSLPYLWTEPVRLSPVPALFTPRALDALGGEVGGGTEFEVAGLVVRPVGSVAAMPGVAEGEAVAVDLGWVTYQYFRHMRTPPAPNEWWVATSDAATVAERAAALPVLRQDRQRETERLLGDPLGSGVLLALWASAAAGALLAAFGLLVDSRANAVRRRRELAVLHTLGVAPSGLARALVVEQVVLAGLGVTAGVAVGLAVAAAMGPSLVLTAAGAAPVPAVLLVVSPAQLAGPAVGLLLAAVVLGALVARRARREVAAGALRIGEE